MSVLGKMLPLRVRVVFHLEAELGKQPASTEKPMIDALPIQPEVKRIASEKK